MKSGKQISPPALVLKIYHGQIPKEAEIRITPSSRQHEGAGGFRNILANEA